MSHRVEAASLVLTPVDARMLYQAARIGELRSRHRIGDSALYRLLTDISVCAFGSADSGTEDRQNAASEDREWWTTQQLAKKTGRADRTVRLACERGELDARKLAGAWAIPSAAAATYVESHGTP